MKTLTILLAALLSFPVFADSETETNNTESTADTLSPGILTSGNLSSEDDIDFFAIELGGTESFELVFAAPDVMGTGDQWLIIVQRPSDGIIIYQEVLSPTSASPITRNIAIDENGVYLVRIAPAGGSSPTPSATYNLTITPDNFQPELGGIGGVWQDQIDNTFYSIHENAEGLLYIELSTNPLGWNAFLGSRSGTKAVLELVVGPGSATLEILFTSATTLEARYLACQTEAGTMCTVLPGDLLYNATKVFSD